MNDSIKKKINGYSQWVGLILAVSAIIWSASRLNYQVESLKEELADLKVNHKIELELLRDEIKELRLEVKLLKSIEK